jgi:hypothetical protein
MSPDYSSVANLSPAEQRAMSTLFPLTAPIRYRHNRKDTVTLWASSVNEYKKSRHRNLLLSDIYQLGLFFVPDTRDIVLARAKSDAVVILPAVASWTGALQSRTKIMTMPEVDGWKYPRVIASFRADTIVDLLEGADAMKKMATVINRILLSGGTLKGHAIDHQRTGMGYDFKVTLFDKNFSYRGRLEHYDIQGRGIKRKRLKKAVASFR